MDLPLALSLATKTLVIGAVYEHYKKKRYKILAVARHTETLEELVIYQALYGEGLVWARPLSMFLESVFVDGRTCPRFILVPTN